MAKHFRQPSRGAAPEVVRGECGFTLLEVLVVVAIIAVLAAAVVPSLGTNRGRDVQNTAERLVLLINRAQQEAVLSSRAWRLVLEPGESTYRFQARKGDSFQAVEVGPFKGAHRTANIRWSDLAINGQRSGEKGEVYLYPSGEQDPFRLTLRTREQSRTVTMGPVGDARVESQP
ncbi:MAG: GspH/FimT family pseudopilin [Thiohalorhabdaceae bacterium]